VSGFRRWGSSVLVLACLLLMPALGALANSVPTGGSGTFPPTSSSSVFTGWAIYDPSGALIASTGPYPGSSGWNASFTVSVTGGVASISSITVTAPATAGIGTGYRVVVAGPAGNNAASFDVVASGSVTPYAVNGLTISPNSIYSGDWATGTVTINTIAPSGGISVALSSTAGSDPNNYALVSPTVIVPQGRSVGIFSIPTRGTASAMITASNAGASASGFIGVGSSPTVQGTMRVGQSASFGPVAQRGNAALWAIYNPSGTIIASSGGPAPTNGWNVSFSTYYNGQYYTIGSISVTAPVTATPMFGYSVAVAGPGGNNVAYFNLTF
jgi:hypothetical protein